MTRTSATVRKGTHSLAQQLVSDLTQRILTGQLAPGNKLPPENTLVREHGVSRTVVREALSRLQASGLVETRHGIGTFVLTRSEVPNLRLSTDTALSVRSILELRLGLETQAAALAAQRRTEEHLRLMRQALDDFQKALDEERSCEDADQRFHWAIAQATGNDCYIDVMGYLGQSLIPRSRIGMAERGEADLIRLGYLANREHEAILDAIVRQDADAARAAMWLHLTHSRERLNA